MAGGGGLLPPLLAQLLLQKAAGEVAGSGTAFAKPLKAAGACPPERLFSWFQLLSHHVTFVEDVAAATV